MGETIPFADLDCFLVDPMEEFPFEENRSTNSGSSGRDTADLMDETAFLPGTEEFRRARKRRQNRESAARNRARKHTEIVDLEIEVQKLTKANIALSLENEALRMENKMLKGEICFGDIVKPEKEEPRPRKRSRREKIGEIATCLMVSVLAVCLLFQESAGGAANVQGIVRGTLAEEGVRKVTPALFEPEESIWTSVMQCSLVLIFLVSTAKAVLELKSLMVKEKQTFIV